MVAQMPKTHYNIIVEIRNIPAVAGGEWRAKFHSGGSGNARPVVIGSEASFHARYRYEPGQQADIVFRSESLAFSSQILLANNATVGGTLVPTLALGIPGDASSAMLLGALLILGFVPGPILFEQQPELVGGIFLVYLTSNVFLLIAGIALTPFFVYVLRIPKFYLIPIVLLLCSIGTFALQASVFDLGVMLGFGLIGIFFRAANYPLSPIVIGLILGPILEANLRRSLLISREGYWIFLDRPVAATLVAVNCLLIVGALVYALRKRQRRSMNKIGETPN